MRGMLKSPVPAQMDRLKQPPQMPRKTMLLDKTPETFWKELRHCLNGMKKSPVPARMDPLKQSLQMPRKAMLLDKTPATFWKELRQCLSGMLSNELRENKKVVVAFQMGLLSH